MNKFFLNNSKNFLYNISIKKNIKYYNIRFIIKIFK